MKSVSKNLGRRCWRRFLTYFLPCCLILNTSLPAVMALEQADLINSSGATFTQWGDNTIIDTDHRAIINWNNFNTSSGQNVQFNQILGGVESPMSAVLNRVNSGVATEFLGALTANGRVFIVNPAGILFGGGSTVNVTQLVASGLNMTDDAFNTVLDDPANQMQFVGGDGEVTNRGIIRADSVVLVGRKVVNRGSIIAQEGLVVMAAGDNVFLAQDGSNVVVQLATDPGGDTVDVKNRSRISAEGGTVVLAAGDTFSRAVSNGGLLTAGGGTIRAQAAVVENIGILDASAPGASGGDGGNISLIGTEEVRLSYWNTTDTGKTLADAGINGAGGTITLESEGTVTVADNALVSAAGGDNSGDGGHIKITADHFVLAGEVDASPGNANFEAGTLEIDPATVAIANGANTGVEDTLYELDIETLSDNGTNVVVYADDGIVVEDIIDGTIDGSLGSIELHATGADSSVSFVDTTNTISTTLGDIVMEAGSGGIVAGSLETAKDPSNDKPTAGRINLRTTNGGNITAENLIIRDGWGQAEIKVNASGDLTVNGDVIVGSDFDILNVPNGQDAEALVSLQASGDVILDGDVGAHAHGQNPDDEGSVTKATISVSSRRPDDGTVTITINGNLLATAQSSSNGTSEALVEIRAWGDIEFAPGITAHAIADNGAAEVQGTEPAEEWSEDDPPDHAQIIIGEPPQSPPVGNPDFSEIHMGSLLEGNVRENDIDPDGDSLTVALVDGPANAASFTLNPDGSYSYTPNEGFVGEDSFTYEVSDGIIAEPVGPITATITITNSLPVLADDTVTTSPNISVVLNVLANDFDVDGDPLTVDSFNYSGTGTLVRNPDGTFTYTPGLGFLGQETFTYSASDPEIGAEPDQATVTITVSVLPGPPPLPPSLAPSDLLAPGLQRVEFEISGCTALVKWTAEELGVDTEKIEVWIANALASTRNIQPCDACARLKAAAAILQDADGSHITALAQVINDLASSTAPPTEEQMASIANAITRNSDPENAYTTAGAYLNALTEYVAFLNSELDLSGQESVEFVTTKYAGQLAETANVGVATYVAAVLADLAQ